MGDKIPMIGLFLSKSYEFSESSIRFEAFLRYKETVKRKAEELDMLSGSKEHEKNIEIAMDSINYSDIYEEVKKEKQAKEKEDSLIIRKLKQY